jgi:hypothetical protein
VKGTIIPRGARASDDIGLRARDLDPRENATVGLLKQPIEADFQPN